MDYEQDTIEVKRAVYNAAKILEKVAETDKDVLEDWHLAEEKRDKCRQAGDDEKADFWHEVFNYLMTLDCVAAGVEIIIIDDDIVRIDQASEILARMYAEGAERKEKALSIHLFGIKYADQIKDMSLEELAIGAGVPKSYKTELQKGINLAKDVEVKN